MLQEISNYNNEQNITDKEICDILAKAINENLPKAENKIWHRHPVWFLDGNPIVGYSKLKNCIRLLFWSGQSFEEESLKKEGSFKAAETRYTSIEQVNIEDLKRWLLKSKDIQWDYKNLVKRKGKLERLKVELQKSSRTNIMLILPYNPAYPKQFDLIKNKILGAFTNLTINIEHVGSTAIPSLAAKPIIDIDIVYRETSDFDIIKTGLSSLGYYHNGDQGITGREVFKRTNQQHDEILDTITHHLYVCKHNCNELQRHLQFRDYLKTNETARSYYQQLKYELAKAQNDRKKYADLKELKANSFINYIILLSKNGV